jgi:inner membrane protein
MNAANHTAFGFGFTALSASFFDVNIYTVELATASIFFALLPDIDTPQSLIGKAVKPLSKRINRAVGHRTATHSIFYLLAITFLASYHSFELGLVAFFGTFSHILGDMITRAGVQFLYPISFAAWVVPGQREQRIKSGDSRAELIIFICCVGLIFSTADLAATGLTSTFNRAFKTFAHARKEALDKTIYIETEQQSGTEIEVQGSKIICWSGSEFFEITADTDIKEIRDTTAIRLETIEFIAIDFDSLMLLNQNIVSAEIQSNLNIRYRQENILRESKILKLEFIETIEIIENEFDNRELVKEKVRLEAEHELLKIELDKERFFEREQKRIYDSLKTNYAVMSDYEKSKALDRLKTIDFNSNTPDILGKLAILDIELKEVNQSLEAIEKQTFTGKITKVWSK